MAWYDFLLPSSSKPTYEDRGYITDQVKSGIAGAQGRPAPQADRTVIGGVRQMDQSQSDQFRGRQMDLANQLGAVATGQQAGAGELSVQRQAQRALGNVAGAATMARGNSAVGGARAAARGAGAIGLGAAGQTQQAALNDQQAARQALAGVVGQGREQDIGIAGQNMTAENQRIFQQAGLDQATSLANMEARLRAIGMNDQAIANYLSTLSQMNAAEIAGTRQDPGMLGSLLQTGGQVGAAYAGRK